MRKGMQKGAGEGGGGRGGKFNIQQLLLDDPPAHANYGTMSYIESSKAQCFYLEALL